MSYYYFYFILFLSCFVIIFIITLSFFVVGPKSQYPIWANLKAQCSALSLSPNSRREHSPSSFFFFLLSRLLHLHSPIPHVPSPFLLCMQKTKPPLPLALLNPLLFAYSTKSCLTSPVPPSSPLASVPTHKLPLSPHPIATLTATILSYPSPTCLPTWPPPLKLTKASL